MQVTGCLREMRGYLKEVADFIFLEDAPAPADLILVCGSGRVEPVQRAAALYHDGYAPRIMPTGRFGERFANFREEMAKVAAVDKREPAEVFEEVEKIAGAAGYPGFPETEWAHQRNMLLTLQVPETAILREDQSVNTFENAIFARRLLEEAGAVPARMILCCQAFHARRAYMTVATRFPGTEILVCPAVTRGLSKKTWLDTATGCEKVFDELEKCGNYFRGENMYEQYYAEHIK